MLPWLVVFIALGGVAVGDNRSYDGLGNHLAQPERGSAGSMLPRIAAAAYGDGMSAPSGANLPNAREISNALCSAPEGEGPNSYGLSDYVWQWGQFLDHDITLVGGTAEPFFIEVGAGDPLQGFIPLVRTAYDPATGADSPREQVNFATSFIDASMVYGSDGVRAAALREFAGGRLKLDADGLMPMNTTGLDNANDLGLPPEQLFLGGDVRSNEQLGLTCMHTVFAREHNRLAAEIAAANPGWDDYAIYHRARKIVGALVQVVTYREFLPALIGPHAPDPAGFVYDPSRDASVRNEFATALYRFGHSMVSDRLLVMTDDGQPAPGGGEMQVLDAFFNPSVLVDEPQKVDWILKGLSMQAQREADPKVVHNLRNQLFGPAGAGGLDLAAINIQRGRDHGLPGYNAVRAAYGLAPKASFAEVSSDAEVQSKLASLYAGPDDVDVWVGGLIEDHASGCAVGELITAALRQQFTDLAEGDRFFYRFDPELAGMVAELEATRLCDIIARNTGLTTLQDDLFHVAPGALAATGPAGRELSVGVVVLGSGDVLLELSGAEPGAAYDLQRSAGGGAWATVGEGLQTGGDGRLEVIDEGAAANLRSALYRFVAD